MKGVKFEILLEGNCFDKGGIIETPESKIKLKVISTPKLYYAKWYFRVLHYITFKQLFNIKVTYTVEVL